jgi:Trypsin
MISKHPNYKSDPIYDDIALIEMNGKANINYFVMPACLWTALNFNFDEMDAFGWISKNCGE